MSQVLYVIDTSRQLLEECIAWEDHITLQVKKLSFNQAFFI